MLSDDSHGVTQVGLNYSRMLRYIRDLGISNYHHVEVDNGAIVIKEHPLNL